MSGPAFNIDVYRGPTDNSNWLIPGRLMVGGLPEHEPEVIRLIHNANINTFVCLQPEKELAQFTPKSLLKKAKTEEELQTLLDMYRIPYKPNAVNAAEAAGKVCFVPPRSNSLLGIQWRKLVAPPRCPCKDWITATSSQPLHTKSPKSATICLRAAVPLVGIPTPLPSSWDF